MGQDNQYFDQIADRYDLQHGVLYFGFEYSLNNYYAPLISKYTSKNDKVLEIGCGTGGLTSWLASQFEDVVGIDLSGEMIDIARKKFPDTKFYQGDCQNLDKFGVKPDVIVGLNTFSYYPNKRESIKNYSSNLRKDGRVIIMDMNPRCPTYPLMKLFKYNEMDQFYNRIKDMQLHNLEKLFLHNGFKILKKGHGNFVHHRFNKLAALPFVISDKLLRNSALDVFGTRVFLVAQKI